MQKSGIINSVALLGLLVCGTVNASVTFDGPVTEIDGRTGPQYTGPGSKDVLIRRRPWTKDEHNLLLQNIYIHDALNQKGIDIGATGNPDGSVWTYDNITVRNYDNVRDLRTIGGLHIDGVRISGAGNTIIHKTNVTLDDVWIHDGGTLPVNIQDGNYGTILVNKLEIDGNALNQFQVAMINTGHTDTIILENSPGVHLAIMGRPGSIGTVIVRNSPGATVGDVQVYGFRSGVKIIYDNSAGGITIPAPITDSSGGSSTTSGGTTTTSGNGGIIIPAPTSFPGGGVGVTSLPSGPFDGGGVSVGSAAAVGSAVPEPSSLGLLAVAGAFLARRRKAA